jgi:SIR2-like domain
LPFPESERDPRTIFLIHLHGRCSARSFPVLDAWGYNILQHDDANYVDLLRRTFTDRAVITLGISWSDPPLRSAAAFVQRTRPYLSKKHLVLYFLGAGEEEIFGDVALKPNAKGMARYWSNAMRAAYGVDVLFVNNETQRQVLQKLDAGKSAEDCSKAAAYKKKLYEAENDPQRLLEIWEQMADFLDACGDYESPLQHRFLREFSGVDSPTSVAVADATHQLAEKLLNFLKGPLHVNPKYFLRVWGTGARIERHLRHHLYLYRPKDESNARQRIWQLLWQRLPVSEWKSLPAQLKFDFLLGKYELKLNNIDIRRFKMDLGRFEDRLSKASMIWSHAPGTHPPKDKVQQRKTLTSMQKLTVELLNIGWESVAAKVTCDHMHLLAILASTTKVNVDEPLAKVTVDQAAHAAKISRSSGCFRRQVKAESIAAMWTLDPVESRVQILGIIRVVEETRSVEPGLLGGLGAALLTCDLRARTRMGQTIKNLKKLAADVFDEAGLHRDYIHDALRYWIPFAPAPIKKQMLNLAEEMGVTLVQG